ncbi:MAG: DUF1592 domain-containing protein [Opitutaceae bacterium]
MRLSPQVIYGIARTLVFSVALPAALFSKNILETHSFEQHIQPLIQQYCYSCHGEGDKIKGDIDLTPYKTGDHIFTERDTWLYVLEQIETEEMPTEEPLPTSEERALMVEWIDARLNDIDWSQVREAGRVTIPRLNNTEYKNTLRDLLGVETNAASTFSKDGEGQSGFTTDRDNLFITASDMEKYFRAADRALEATIALEAPPMSKRLESEDMFMTESDPVKTIGGLKGYEINRGQMTLYESVDFPYDGLYQFSIKGLSTVGEIGALRLRIDDEPSGDYTFEGTGVSTQSVWTYVNKGTHQISFNFEKSLLPPQIARKYQRANKVGSTIVDWVQVTGPVRSENAPKQSPVFFVKPSNDITPDEAAYQIIERFTKRAFRRPVDRVDVLRYYSIYQSAIEQGETFTPSIKLALSAVLISPKFLFRHEFAPSNTAGEFALDDFQIASRLSYFLWMSMPDEELFALATEGKLRNQNVLRAQVRRMVLDPKSRSFTSAFLGEWLGYQSVGESVIPDAKIFPEFDQALATAMKDETILTFEHLVKNNYNVLHLLNTNATFINDRLAKHYKIEGVEGEHMRPVTIRDPNRGGLLGMASVLTATSSQTRSSPVLRGKWVLETLLGEHIPEPPADAGELSADAGRNKGKTLREELLIHRDNPDCRSCHERIDPIGFGLENFDAIGRFRQKVNGKPIDNTGIVQGFQFSGIAELKAWLIAERKDAFIDNMTRRMLAFALGRDLETFDQAALLKIQGALARNDYGTLTLIEEIVLSYPFLHQNNEQPELADL